ncbi:MAG: glycosyl transferase family 28, partial [Candidatus Thiodiazotropha endolucinida]|nr:glycosyl transferase family 28 [Candidatus Thiodiazotropha endolucinida]
VAHAGMGSILSSLSLGKPIIIMPRKASLGEHRNEHQMATAKRFQNRPGVYVAWDEKQLVVLLNRWSIEKFDNVDEISNTAPTEFIANLKQLIGNTQ